MKTDNCIFNCEICGGQRAWPAAMKDAPQCCGRVMQKVEMAPCRSTETPEHARTGETGEPCDDSRGGPS